MARRYAGRGTTHRGLVSRARGLQACPHWAVVLLFVTGTAMGWLRGVDINDAVSLGRTSHEMPHGTTVVGALSAASLVPVGCALRECRDENAYAWVDATTGLLCLVAGSTMAVLAAPELAVVGGTMVVAGLTASTVRTLDQSKRHDRYRNLAYAATAQRLNVQDDEITTKAVAGQEPVAVTWVNDTWWSFYSCRPR